MSLRSTFAFVALAALVPATFIACGSSDKACGLNCDDGGSSGDSSGSGSGAGGATTSSSGTSPGATTKGSPRRGSAIQACHRHTTATPCMPRLIQSEGPTPSRAGMLWSPSRRSVSTS